MKVKITFLLIIAVLAFNVQGQDVLKVGDKAPEIIQNSITGDEIKLSDLEGKLVLIDFWASWCKPCRKENPNIVEIYKEYKDENFKNGEGFTVLSVSLDFKKDAWEKAISDDNLEWSYHVADMKGWRNEAAQLYHVKSIPASFLIDGNGIIIGMNLRGDRLEDALKKQRKNKSFFSSKD